MKSFMLLDMKYFVIPNMVQLLPTSGDQNIIQKLHPETADDINKKAAFLVRLHSWFSSLQFNLQFISVRLEIIKNIQTKLKLKINRHLSIPPDKKCWWLQVYKYYQSKQKKKIINETQQSSLTSLFPEVQN